jgi:hypothetical protein
VQRGRWHADARHDTPTGDAASLPPRATTWATDRAGSSCVSGVCVARGVYVWCGACVARVCVFGVARVWRACVMSH